MDEELKALMRRDVEISEESLKILRSMRRAQRIGTVFAFVKWIFIIAVTLGAYYVAQPFLEKGLEVIANPAELLDSQGQNIINPNTLSSDTINKIKDALLKGSTPR